MERNDDVKEKSSFIRDGASAIFFTASLTVFTVFNSNPSLPFYNNSNNYKCESVNEHELEHFNDSNFIKEYDIQRNKFNAENIAFEMFGEMREATFEEQRSIEDNIKKKAKKTGINFFDLC